MTNQLVLSNPGDIPSAAVSSSLFAVPPLAGSTEFVADAVALPLSATPVEVPEEAVSVLPLGTEAVAVEDDGVPDAVAVVPDGAEPLEVCDEVEVVVGNDDAEVGPDDEEDVLVEPEEEEEVLEPEDDVLVELEVEPDESAGDGIESGAIGPDGGSAPPDFKLSTPVPPRKTTGMPD